MHTILTPARVAIVTGASRGIGAAIARRLARDGMQVVVNYASGREAADALVASILADGGAAIAVKANVADAGDVQALFAAAEAAFGGVDVLVNNAGIATGGRMVDTTMAEWHNVIEVNLLGVVRGCRLFLPGMVAAGHGQVINTASFAGLAGAPNIMSYGVTKAAVVALSEQLRAEVQDKGIGVSVVCPSFFRTNLLESWQGNDRMKAYADKMMANSPDTLDSVADAAFAAAERGQFLILPTHKSPMLWRLKRWLPDFYFRNMLKVANRATKGA